jgi:hypothetical protein
VTRRRGADGDGVTGRGTSLFSALGAPDFPSLPLTGRLWTDNRAVRHSKCPGGDA